MCIKNSKVSLTLVGDAVGELEGESEGVLVGLFEGF